MSWLKPPPLLEKPAHPMIAMSRPKRYWFVYAFGFLSWFFIVETILSFVLLMRFLFGGSFIPTRFLLWEGVSIAVAILVNHILTTRLIYIVMKEGKEVEALDG